MTTEVTGIFAQSATGTYGVDIDMALTTLVGVDPLEPAEADVLLGGEAMTFDGLVDLTLINVGKALPGEHQALIARSATSLTATDLQLASPATAVATYSLVTTATDLALNYAIDFSPVGMNPNQSALGEYINRVQLAGGSVPLEPVIEALFNLPDIDAYASALDQLTPEPYAVNQISSVTGSLQFENSLMSCRVYGGAEKFNAEGECAWASAFGGDAVRDATSGNLGYDSSWSGLSMGAQVAVNEIVRAGIGVSYARSSFDIGDNASGSGEHWQVGGVVKAVMGATTLAGSLTGGTSGYDMGRIVELPNGPSYILRGDQRLDYIAAHARLSHVIANDSGYIRPYLDVGVTNVHARAFNETGGPVALNLQGDNDTFVTIEGAMEFGAEFQATETTVVRPFASFGVIAFPDGTSPGVSATFVDAPAAAEPFRSVSEVDSVFADAKLGLDIISEAGMTFRAMGEVQVGDISHSYGGNVKLGLPF